MAGVGAVRDHLVLEAIAAERMPHRMVVCGVPASPFFELRDYGSGAGRMAEVLKRHGIRSVWEESGRHLFPFGSLAARERAWREVSVDPEWVAISPKEIAVYRIADLQS
jgi:hypothetical protein